MNFTYVPIYVYIYILLHFCNPLHDYTQKSTLYKKVVKQQIFSHVDDFHRIIANLFLSPYLSLLTGSCVP